MHWLIELRVTIGWLSGMYVLSQSALIISFWKGWFRFGRGNEKEKRNILKILNIFPLRWKFLNVWYYNYFEFLVSIESINPVHYIAAAYSNAQHFDFVYCWTGSKAASHLLSTRWCSCKQLVCVQRKKSLSISLKRQIEYSCICYSCQPTK